MLTLLLASLLFLFFHLPLHLCPHFVQGLVTVLPNDGEKDVSWFSAVQSEHSMERILQHAAVTVFEHPQHMLQILSHANGDDAERYNWLEVWYEIPFLNGDSLDGRIEILERKLVLGGGIHDSTIHHYNDVFQGLNSFYNMDISSFHYGDAVLGTF